MMIRTPQNLQEPSQYSMMNRNPQNLKSDLAIGVTVTGFRICFYNYIISFVNQCIVLILQCNILRARHIADQTSFPNKLMIGSKTMLLWTDFWGNKFFKKIFVTFSENHLDIKKSIRNKNFLYRENFEFWAILGYF